MGMTREEKAKAIDALKISAPVMVMTQEKFNDYIKTLNQVMDWLEQESKTGHWILTDIEDYRVWYCNCSECGKDPQDYIGGSEDWWLIRNNLPKFCPNCGAKMVEPQESKEKIKNDKRKRNFMS